MALKAWKPGTRLLRIALAIALPHGWAQAAAWTGVAVEDVAADTAIERAGIEAGDVLVSWVRKTAPPANPEEASGQLASAFDWMALEIEQAPRGTVELRGQRGEISRTFTVKPGLWKAAVRPEMPEKLLAQYLRGLEHLASGEVSETVNLWRAVAALASDEGLRSWMLLRLGQVQARHGEWEAAVAAYRSALEVAPAPQAQVLILHALGQGYAARAEYEQARAKYDEAREIQERSTRRPSLLLAKSLHSLGNVATDVGDLAAAQQHHQRALSIRQASAPGSLAMTHSLNNLGIVAAKRGDLARAAESFQEALEIRRQLAPGSLALARGLNNLGILTAMLGDLAEATDLHLEALAIEQELVPGSLDVAWSLNNLGVVTREVRDLAKAAEFHQRALAIKEELSPGSLTVADSLVNLGLVARDRGESAEAANLFQRALSIERRLAPGGLAEANSLRNLALLAKDRGDLPEAKEYLERALTIRQKLAPDSAELAEVFHELGLLHRLTHPNDPEKAAELFRDAVSTVEGQLTQLGGAHGVRAGFRARYHRYYRHALESELALGRREAAFHTLERSRARSFLEQLAERDIVFTADMPPQLAQQRRRLAARFNRVHRSLAGLHPSRQAQEVEQSHRQLRRLRAQAKEIEGRLRRSASRLTSLQYPQPLDFEASRAALDPGTLMLSYSVGESSTLLFAVSRGEELRVETLAIREPELRARVQRLRRLIVAPAPGGRGQRSREAAGRQLFSTLIEPVADLVAQSRRLLFVADGPLHTLPWSALIHELGNGESQYLVEWKPLHSVLSATVYVELKKNRRSPGASPLSVALFGDPRYPTLRATEPDAEPGESAQRGLDFRPLPYTRQEVQRIAQLYPDARTYLGAEATEARAKALDKSLSIVHFATHGTLDDRWPMSSALALSIPEEFSEGDDNGLLHAWEIFESVRLDADLVVLSACDAALGKELGGEGLISLTRAFQFAGSRTTVATLWKVADQATAVLMERFYRHLRSGKTKIEALRSAQVELIRSPIEVRDTRGQVVEKDASKPFYWAAFQIHGDWQ